MRFGARSVAVSLVTMLASQTARAENAAGASLDERRPAAFVVGAVTLLVPLALGANMMTLGGIDPKRAGWYACHAGFVLAPMAAHGVMGEWGRGALFSLVPLAPLGVSVGIVESNPRVLSGGKASARGGLELMLSAGFLASGVGVVDALFAGDRARRRLHVTPIASADFGGVYVSGVLE